MQRTEEYQHARGRAEAKYRFFVHAAAFLAVMLLLIVINILTSPGNFWFIWPLIGWGLAVALHGVRAFLMPDESEIIDALTKRELDRAGSNESEERR